MKLNNWITHLLFAGIMITAVFVSGCSGTSDIKQEEVPFNGETKTVALSLDSNYVYSPQVITVKAGTKLRIEADTGKLQGTMDTLVIEGFDVRKRLTPNDNVVEFVAGVPGEYEIQCANGMGEGKLIVE